MHRVIRIAYQKQPAAGNYTLSAETLRRLKIIDWYRLKSAYFSTNKKANAVLTCRHFGIRRSYFNRWWTRYRKGGVHALEDKSRSPQRKRQAMYDMKLVGLIREIRKDNPGWFAKKIRVTLSWEMEGQYVPGVSSIGRIIKKYNMFYRSDIQTRTKRRKTAGKAADRKRKPYNLRAHRPHEIIEFDMKQINLSGKTLYALCAIDQYTRRPVVHVSSSCSSAAGKTALQKTKQQFTKDIIIINDNGNENMGKAEQWLKEEQITQ